MQFCELNWNMYFYKLNQIFFASLTDIVLLVKPNYVVLLAKNYQFC